MEILLKILSYDDHRSSDKPNSISVTQLLGPKYKANLILKDTPEVHKLDLVLKRSSFIGTAMHQRMEHILKQDEDYVTEIYKEREIEVGGVTYTVSGSCDLLHKVGPTIEDGWEIADLKSFYGKSRKQEQLDKDAMQMSLYRWLLQDDYNIVDRAWVIAISQSNNYINELPVALKSINWIQNWVEENIYAIVNNTVVDCKDTSYNSCLYCTLQCSERKGK